jgi:hypothetical protein
MSSNLALSIAAALVLCAGVARAEQAPSGAADAAESGIPDSIGYGSRMFSLHSPSNEEIARAERCNPESVDNRDRTPVSSRPLSDADWLALEFGNPDVR